jgi:hypothetical protein
MTGRLIVTLTAGAIATTAAAVAEVPASALATARPASQPLPASIDIDDPVHLATPCLVAVVMLTTRSILSRSRSQPRAGQTRRWLGTGTPGRWSA